MTPLQMIAEWRKGCSHSQFDQLGRPYKNNVQWRCQACTEGLIDAIERWHLREVQACPKCGYIPPEDDEQRASVTVIGKGGY